MKVHVVKIYEEYDRSDVHVDTKYFRTILARDRWLKDNGYKNDNIFIDRWDGPGSRSASKESFDLDFVEDSYEYRLKQEIEDAEYMRDALGEGDLHYEFFANKAKRLKEKLENM